MPRPMTEEQVNDLIQQTPRQRGIYDAAQHGGGRFIVTGRPDSWSATAKSVEEDGGTVVAFHDILRKHYGAIFEGKPVYRGDPASRYHDATVLFAGRPAKAWFNPSPPGPEVCLFHTPPVDWQRKGRHMPELWREHKDRIVALFSSLADQPSRDVLASIVKARVEGDSGFHRISRYGEYQHPVVQAEPGDVVIDAGAYDGDMTEVFSRRVGRRGRVVALEPDPKNYVALADVARNLRNVVPLCVGAWDKNEVLTFKSGANASSMIADDGDTSIAVTSIDDVVETHRLKTVDLIKMDIEGGEAKAIEGAARTIKRHRPKMQISIYHKFHDIYSLPELLRPMLPNYRFYLGHHSYYQMETDLYAIPIEKWTRRRARGYLGRARRFVERRITSARR